MVFAGVFDFVVANAAEGLHEEHNGGDAGAGDFGGVMQGAGGHFVGFAAGYSQFGEIGSNTSAKNGSFVGK